jgi:hypothetical protein
VQQPAAPVRRRLDSLTLLRQVGEEEDIGAVHRAFLPGAAGLVLHRERPALVVAPPPADRGSAATGLRAEPGA